MKRKMDRYLISKQTWELDYIVAKMKKEGITVTADMVSDVIKEVGRSRRQVYKNIRENYC